MGNERSGDDVAGILAILLRASRLAEATPELGWAGKKPVRSGTPKPLRRRKSQRSQVSQGRRQLWMVLYKVSSPRAGG